MKLLDVTSLPREATYGPPGNQTNLAALVARSRAAIYELGRGKLVKPVRSFGFAMAQPVIPSTLNWKDPNEFIWFVFGWGPVGDRYVANAVRKLRAVLRTGQDTLTLRTSGGELFKRRVATQEVDGSFRWGDFPWGGGVLTTVGDHVFAGAVSCFLEVEDHAVAHLLTATVGGMMMQLDDPQNYGPNS